MSKKKSKKSLKIVLMLLLVLILAVPTFGYVTYTTMLKPVTVESVGVNFLVSANDNLTTITNKLEAEDIIQSALAGKIYGKVSKTESFVEGAFTLDKNWDTQTILTHLTNSKNVISNEVSVTLREGLWAKDMAKALSLKLDITEENLLELWNDETYVKGLISQYEFLSEDILNPVLKVKLEGYLAPNTYNFYIDSSAEEITKKLLNQTEKIFNTYYDQFMASDYSVHELFTLASLTQYESGDFAEDQIIAGIWYNRLDINMRLESSVTICYALYDFESWEDCERYTNIDSPYNSYRNAGIIPGPVTNPGENSIKATLMPQDSDYLFFLADVYGDGSIYYSKTYEEHVAKVNKYLR